MRRMRVGSSESALTTVENHILDLPTWSHGWGWSGGKGRCDGYSGVQTEHDAGDRDSPITLPPHLEPLLILEN